MEKLNHKDANTSTDIKMSHGIYNKCKSETNKISDTFNTPSVHDTQDSKNMYTTTTGIGPSSTGHHQVFIYRFRSIRRERSCPFTTYLKNYHILY
jgi:hypothetical protein